LYDLQRKDGMIGGCAMAIKEQRYITYDIIRSYEELVKVLSGELAKHDPKEAIRWHDEAIRLRRSSEKVGLR
jgi:hypothetical protein